MGTNNISYNTSFAYCTFQKENSKYKIFPKLIISDETSIDSPYIKFVNNNRYENVIFPIEDPSNFLDTMYIGLAKRDLD